MESRRGQLAVMPLALVRYVAGAALASFVCGDPAHARCGTWSEGFAAGLRGTTAPSKFDAGAGELVYVATTTLSQRGFVTPGSGALRHYSVFYRSSAATFCPPATANVTNGVRVIW